MVHACIYVCMFVCVAHKVKQPLNKFEKRDSLGPPISVHQRWQDVMLIQHACSPLWPWSYTGPRRDIWSYYCLCLWRVSGWNRWNYVSVCVFGAVSCPWESLPRSTDPKSPPSLSRMEKNGKGWLGNTHSQHTAHYQCTQHTHTRTHTHSSVSQVCAWRMIES